VLAHRRLIGRYRGLACYLAIGVLLSLILHLCASTRQQYAEGWAVLSPALLFGKLIATLEVIRLTLATYPSAGLLRRVIHWSRYGAAVVAFLSLLPDMWPATTEHEWLERAVLANRATNVICLVLLLVLAAITTLAPVRGPANVTRHRRILTLFLWGPLIDTFLQRRPGREIHQWGHWIEMGLQIAACVAWVVWLTSAGEAGPGARRPLIRESEYDALVDTRADEDVFETLRRD
jgi:hypothetical protein